MANHKPMHVTTQSTFRFAWGAGTLHVMKRICAVAGPVLVLGVLSGCAAVPDGYADSWAGRTAAAKMCRSMRAFVRAPLDDSGLRRAWFLPFGHYEDGSFDFYAPMASKPGDAASKSFYHKKVGQLTHYLTAPRFAAVLAGCLSRRSGYTRVCQAQTEHAFRASFTDTRSGRSVEILAEEQSTTVLVARKGWNGDLEKSLKYETSEQTPDQSACTKHSLMSQTPKQER